MKLGVKDWKPIDWAILVASVIYGGSLIFYAGSLYESQLRFGIIFLSLSVIMVVLVSVKEKKFFYPLGEKFNRIVAAGYIAFALAIMFYFYDQYTQLMLERGGVPNTLDYVFSVIALLVVLETSRRSLGPIIPGMVLLFWFYAYFGYIFPGELFHGGLRIRRIIAIAVPEMGGIYGTLNQLGATYIGIFVFYAGLIQGFGGLELVLKGGRWIVQKSMYMIAEVAVIGSLLFGMFSGSSAANAAGTGTFTIPLMKKAGIPAKMAAATESVASSLGQAMPPVMGASIFVMTDYLNKRYIDLVAIAFIPALIVYFTVFVAVYILSRNYLTKAAEQAPSGRKFSAIQEFASLPETHTYEAIPIVGSVIVLMVLLAVLKMGVLVAGFFTICSFLAMQFIVRMAVARGKPAGAADFGKGILLGLKAGALNLAPIGVTLASMGIILKVLVVTGLSQKLSFIMVDTAGGNFVILMFLVAIVCILFGMAVSTVACYILVAVIAAPALLHFGVPLVASHFAVFYIAILAGITPPVAPVCLLTASLAKSAFLPTCWESVKVGIGVFIIPFAFMIHPEIFEPSISTLPLVVFLFVAGLGGMVLALTMPWAGVVGIAKRAGFLILGGLVLFGPTKIAVGCAVAIVALSLKVIGVFGKGELPSGAADMSKPAR
jgi:TRAP transporter 4TM/12TM fusion protein